MSNNDPPERIDDVLNILAKPISRYILSVLAGIDPGVYTGAIEGASEEDSKAVE